MSQAQEQAAAKTILVVEDDAAIGDFLLQALSQETTYQAVLVTDGIQALNIIKKVKPVLLIFNYHLLYMTGLELYDRLQAIKEVQGIPAILISATVPRQEAAKRGIVAIEKPFALDHILATVEKLID